MTALLALASVALATLAAGALPAGVEAAATADAPAPAEVPEAAPVEATSPADGATAAPDAPPATAAAPEPAPEAPRAEGASPAAGVLTRAPEVVTFVPAEYPPDAASAGISGSVTLSVVIDETGEVQQVAVLDPGPHPAFAQAALHAVACFRFRPAEIDGVPAPVEITYRYDFVLRQEPAAAQVAEAPVVLSGRVVDRGSGQPVRGAAVEAGGVTTETDAEGRFALRGLAPGTVQVRVVSQGHAVLKLAEVIEADRAREVEYRLSPRRVDPYEAVVRGEPPRREITVRKLSVDQVRTVAGTQGDTLKVVQNLPGVARAPFGIGLLVVRGSDPNDSVVTLDGMPVPLLFHFGGLTSVVSSDVIEGLDFYPGNFAARYGRALGGAVDLRTREPRHEGHGLAQLDVFDGRLQLETPVGSGSGFVAVRRSWVDAVLAVALPRVAPDTANELRVAPRYYDYQAKVEHPLLGGTVSLVAYGSDDAMTYVKDDEKSNRPTFYLSTLFHRVAVRWRGTIGRFQSDGTVAAGRDSFDVLQSDDFGVLTEVRALSVREALTYRASERFALELGVDTLVRQYEYEVYAPPLAAAGAVGSPIAEDAPLRVGERARGTWLAPGGWIEADVRPSRRLRVVAGLRADGDSRLRRSPAWIDPRVSAFYELREGTTLLAAAGLYGAAPAVQETTKTFGNPDLGPQHALHLSAGVQQALPWDVRVEATGWHKEMWDLVVQTRATDAAGELEHLSNGGRGEATGLELLVRREARRGPSGWISYTLSRAIRRDDASMPSYPRWHPFMYDQPNVLTAVATQPLPRGWSLGARVRLVSGNPYTPYEGAVLDANSGRYRCIPSARPYSGRMPGFFQADARVDRRWTFRRWKLSTYLDVQNVTNHDNAEYWFPSYDCSEQVAIPSVPLLPTFGLRAEW